MPSDWTTTLTFDIQNGQPQFQPKGDDLTVSNVDIGLSQMTFDSLPSTVVVGDWISVSNTSVIPQIPYQLFPYLAQCVANLCMAGMADSEPYQDGVRKLALMKEDLLKLLQPRDMGNVQTIVNRGGLFDNGQFWGWGSGNYW